MKLTIALLLTAFLQISFAAGYSQNVTLTEKNISLEQVLKKIRKQTGYTIIWDAYIIKKAKPVNIQINNGSLAEALKQCFEGQPVTYAIEHTAIIVQPKAKLSSLETADINITGKVTDEKGLPLSGVSIMVKGTTLGVTTDQSGHYSITLPNPGGTLIFSFIGYENYEVAVNGHKLINVILTNQSKGLNEVIVVGYGTQKKVTLTGSVASVTNSEINTTTNENVINMLAGKVAGLRVVQKSSEPGRFNTEFDIRGFGNPLIVIDGVPRDNFNRLNPDEIETLSVLKDAAAAVYGVRAANGVVLITTKKGKAGKTILKYEASYGIQQPSGEPKALNASEWMTLSNELALNTKGAIQFPVDMINKYNSGELKGTDWIGIGMRSDAPLAQQNLSASGGTDKVKFYISFNYLKQDGLLQTNDLNYNRYNIRSNITAQLTNNLSAELLIGAMTDKKNQPFTEMDQLYKGMWMQLPIAPAYINGDLKYPGAAYDGLHPGVVNNVDLSGYKEIQNKNFQGSFALNYEIPFIKGLKAKGLFSYDYYTEIRKEWRYAYRLNNLSADGTTIIPTSKYNNPSNLRRRNLERNNKLMQFSLNYAKSLAGKHNFGGLLLYEESSRMSDNFIASREYTFDVIDELFSGNNSNQGANTDIADLYSLANKGFVGRLNYDFSSKYLVEFSFRYDGSSKFMPGHQWGFFPATSLGWRLSEEKFFKNTRALNFINSLKFRGSYGKTGDDNASNYQFLTGYTYPSGGNVFNGTFYSGLGFLGLANPNLSWFTATSMNVGIDVEMWNGLLGAQVDLFKRNRDGLLATRLGSLPGTVGANLAQENLESDITSGFEAILTHRNKLRTFSYNISANASFTRTKWGNREIAHQNNSYRNWRNNTSNRYNNVWWGMGSNGVFTSVTDAYDAAIHDQAGNKNILPGDRKYEDWNGDGIIDDYDIHPISNRSTTGTTMDRPLIGYGITLGGTFKNIDFNFLVQGASIIYARYPEQLERPLNFSGRNGLSQFMDRWHTADPTANPFDPATIWIPGRFPTTRGTNTFNYTYDSEAVVQDASYIRLKSVELGYSLSVKQLRKTGIQAARFFVNGYNLLTFTGVKNIDPEHPSDNFGYVYPLVKSYNAGISVSF